MQMPEFPLSHKFPDTLNGWDAWRENRAAWYAYWTWMSKRRFHALPEDKGVPVPHTGRRHWHSRKDSGKTGVIGSSRMLPHRYMDEGDKGKDHNRHIKRLEKALWLREWVEEQQDQEEGYSASEWFYEVPSWWEWEDETSLDDDESDYYWEPRACSNLNCKICYA